MTDIDRAKAQLRQIQDRWEEVGRVPSADLHRIEGRLRAVEAASRNPKKVASHQLERACSGHVVQRGAVSLG